MRCADRPDAVLVEQLWVECPDPRRDVAFVLVRFVCGGQAPFRDRAYRRDDAGVVAVVPRQPEFRALDDEEICAQPPQALAGSVRQADQEGFQLPDRVGAGVYRSAPRDHEYPQRFPGPPAFPRLGVAVAADDHSRGADRVELVALAAGIRVAPVGVVDLRHPLTRRLEHIVRPAP